MEPPFNEVPRDWGNLFVTLRVCYIVWFQKIISILPHRRDWGGGGGGGGVSKTHSARQANWGTYKKVSIVRGRLGCP